MIKLRLEELLKERGRSFYWLAKETGITHPTISKFRHQKALALRLDVLEKLCEALQCEPGDILVRAPARKSASK